MNMNLLERGAHALEHQDYTSAYQAYRTILNEASQYSATQLGKAHYGLGYIAQLHHDWPNAIDAFQHACKFLPEESAPLLGLANAFNAVLSDIDALTTLRYAHERFGSDDNVSYAYLQQTITMGKTDTSCRLIKQLLSSKQNELFAMVLLDAIKLDQGLIENQHIQRASALIKHYQALPQPNQPLTLASLFYALGELSYQTHDFVIAHKYWQQANTCQRSLCDFNTQNMVPYFESLLALTHVENVYHERTVIPFTPIFIVSLPRTGSSLLAHQLVQHDTVHIANAGEVTYLSEIVNWLCQQTQHPYPACLAHLTPTLINTARNMYAQHIGIHRHNTAFIIDKLPANFQSIPMIVHLFPEAHIIHLTRAYANTAMSIMRNSFGANEPYFCDEEELFIYMNHYHQTMMHFTQLYSEHIIPVRYEALVQDLMDELEMIFTRLGLILNVKMDKDHPAITDTSIRTLSALQARQPIYQTSIELAPYWQSHFMRFDHISTAHKKPT